MLRTVFFSQFDLGGMEATCDYEVVSNASVMALMGEIFPEPSKRRFVIGHKFTVGMKVWYKTYKARSAVLPARSVSVR